MELAKSLHSVLEACPFDHLGLLDNADGAGFILRSWYPEAEQMTAVDLDSGKSVGTLKQIDERGLFELKLPRRKKRFNYKCVVTIGGKEFEYLDPYQFGERTFTDLPTSEDRQYTNMGAQLCSATTVTGEQVEGIRFAVYAPNARSVSVVGDFNNWDGRLNPMASYDDGVWRLFIPGLQAGTKYKYELKNLQGQRLPHKSDPYGFYSEQYPSFNSVVWDHDAYEWHDHDWRNRDTVDLRRAPMSLYEVHIGSWQTDEDGQPLNYHDLADRLIPYVKEMGYTHIELLPISEHPYTGSWGYQPIGLFSPTSRFGDPDQFKYFVDRCHQAGIGVILDWVPAHFPADEHGLARFDGTPLYEYEDPRRGWHPDWNSYIYDFGRKTVADFLVSSALIWLDRFHIDGIRVDAVASMLYLDYSREDGDWVPNIDGGNHNYEAIALLKRFNEAVYGQFPNAVTIAEESTAFAGVSKPTFMGGLGFGFKWNMGWMHDTLEYMQKDPVYRRYHHNELTFSMIYAYDENFILPLSHDEVVHGKGSILNRMPGDEWQQMANARAYCAYMYCHPGKKLNFMGNEFSQGREWNYQQGLDWWLLEYPRHQGMQTLTKDLNHLYRSDPALFELDCEPQGFTWLNHSDASSSVVSFARFSRNRESVLIALCNFTPMPHDYYRVGVPEAGYYEVILNTDSEFYWGSNYDIGLGFEAIKESRDGQPYTLEIKIPPLATVILKKR